MAEQRGGGGDGDGGDGGDGGQSTNIEPNVILDRRVRVDVPQVNNNRLRNTNRTRERERERESGRRGREESQFRRLVGKMSSISFDNLQVSLNGLLSGSLSLLLLLLLLLLIPLHHFLPNRGYPLPSCNLLIRHLFKRVQPNRRR
jgi:hypothetical protein